MGVLIVWAVAAWFLFLFFVFVGPIIAGGSALYFAGALLVAYFQAFGRAMGVGSKPCPAAVETPPARRTDAGREPAYRQYLFGQAYRDLRQAHTLIWPRLVKVGNDSRKQLQENYFGRGIADWRWPIGVVLVAGLALGVFFGLAVIVLLAFAQGAVLLIVAFCAFAGIYLLRGCDTVLLWFRGIRITCPAPECYRRGFYPSYECPNCRARHHDVRPGRYGVVRRVCVCQAKLPTLLLLGSHRMKAFCAYCEKPLAEQVGTAAEVVLPLLGAGGAGKTHLMIVIMMAVEEMARRTDSTLRPADEQTQTWYSQARDEVIRTGKVAKTVVRLPRAHSFHVEPRRGSRRLVHIFDAAGENFNQSDRVQELQYLKLASTFVFVVDPLSIDRLWNSLGSADQERHREVRAAREPEFVFAQTVQNIEAMGVDTGKARLAAVVSKSDLVRDILTKHGVGEDEADLARWLEDDLWQGNMLRAMRHAFAEVRLFLTTAVLVDDRVDASIENLATWVLSKHDLKLRG